MQLLEHKILVDQQLSRHISVANKVEYLKYLKAFNAHESIVLWKWFIFYQHLQVLAPTTYQTTFPMT